MVHRSQRCVHGSAILASSAPFLAALLAARGNVAEADSPSEPPVKVHEHWAHAKTEFAMPPQAFLPTADGALISLAASRSTGLRVFLARDGEARWPVGLNPANGKREAGASAFSSRWALLERLKEETGLHRPLKLLAFLASPLGEGAADGEAPVVPARAFVEIALQGLQPGSYKFWVNDETGNFVTKGAAAAFRFAIVADSHLLSPMFYTTADIKHIDLRMQVEEQTRLLWDFMVPTLGSPSFIVGLGDLFDLHGLTFMPFVGELTAFTSYEYLRHRMQNASVPWFHALGNWEGETGCQHPNASDPTRLRPALARQVYFPTPADAAGRSAGPYGDYFQIEWGGVLIVVLTPLVYTPTCHGLTSRQFMLPRECLQSDADKLSRIGALSVHGELTVHLVAEAIKSAVRTRGFQSSCPRLDLLEGNANEFTLGAAQQAFVEEALSKSDARWKLVMAHHTVGGNALDDASFSNSGYGRGGWQAVRVGEQKWLHNLMVKHRVGAFLQGHDHIFATKPVDGVQYTICGTPSAPWVFHKEGRYEQGPLKYGHVRVSTLPAEGPRAGQEALRVEYVGLDGAVHHAYDLPAIADPAARDEL